MWPIDRPPRWVGRSEELATIRDGAETLRRGGGAVVWVEGEPGIGKSSLVAEALAQAIEPDWDIGWGMADQLAERLPLRPMLDGLQVRLSSPDPRRAQAADLLRSRRLGLFADGDASVNGVEVLVALVDELCAAAPTVLVIEDLQWADDASLLVWHQLAASIDQLRLLLIATCRPTPRRPEVQQVRAAVVRRGGAVVTLGPLPEADVAALVTAMLGTPPSDAVLKLTVQAAGNPLYLRELVDALTRERAQAGPVGGGWPGRDHLPASLTAVLDDRLSSVSAGTAQMLRTAALLDAKFTVTDLAVLLRRPVSDLAAGLQEAVAAGILAGSGQELAFRHPLIRQALYASMPAALRTALHAEAARELAATDADALSVAQQLLAAELRSEVWSRAWLIQAAPALITRAPQLAVGLLRRELDGTPGGDQAWEGLAAGLAQALLAAGSYDEAGAQAGAALLVMTDPVRRAETSSVLARAQVSAGRSDEAITTVRQALASAGLPRPWQARMLAMLAMLERSSSGDLDTADATARRALGVAGGDAFAVAHALIDLWLSHSIRRDHAAALGYIDQALRALGSDPDHADLRSHALNCRVFTLQNLDRWPEAELTLRQARDVAPRSSHADRATSLTAAVLQYWLGQWDDALAELSSDDSDTPGLKHYDLRERGPALLSRGVAALIAGRRDQRTAAGRQLRAGLALSLSTQAASDRENRDFLIAAHALSLEQSGKARQAMLRLAGLLPRRDGEMTLTHQWLPDLVRLAIATDDRPMAQAATQACQAEAAAETQPARAAAASLRCQGLLKPDPVPLRDAVAHYRAAGPAVELAASLEDLAVVLAQRGRDDEARVALYEAVSLYDGLQAAWDIRRADSRLRPYGIRRGVRGRHGGRATTGWEALTPTELRIAAMVARGASTPDIAQGMLLSRRTVQTHISHILTKLGAKGRVDIVREALRQGISA